MENIYGKVVKLTAEILKSWKSNPGVVSPFSSSSSQHQEISDNHLEYYVQKPSTEATPDVASMFNSDLFTNGGEKMTDKTLDVDSSTTTQAQYSNPGTSTTEPDAQSAIAITKSTEIPTTTVGTTANTTTEAPKGGETTEPMEKAEDCPDCGKSMTMCMCDGMKKSSACPHCGQDMPIAKADGAKDEDKETPADEAKETPAEEAAEEKAGSEKEMKKSIWGGAFAPVK